MKFKVFRTHEFIKELRKLPKQVQVEAKKLRDKIIENPFVGDQLSYKFLREKKIGGWRLYFLIYEDIQAVLFVAVSDKKAQQPTIDQIKINLAEYYAYVHQQLKEKI